MSTVQADVLWRYKGPNTNQTANARDLLFRPPRIVRGLYISELANVIKVHVLPAEPYGAVVFPSGAVAKWIPVGGIVTDDLNASALGAGHYYVVVSCPWVADTLIQPTFAIIPVGSYDETLHVRIGVISGSPGSWTPESHYLDDPSLVNGFELCTPIERVGSRPGVKQLVSVAFDGTTLLTGASAGVNSLDVAIPHGFDKMKLEDDAATNLYLRMTLWVVLSAPGGPGDAIVILRQASGESAAAGSNDDTTNQGAIDISSLSAGYNRLTHDEDVSGLLSGMSFVPGDIIRAYIYRTGLSGSDTYSGWVKPVNVSFEFVMKRPGTPF